MFAYCGNSPVTYIDTCGNRRGRIFSFKSDEVGRQILRHYLFGQGEDFPSDIEHSNYLKENDMLKAQLQARLFEYASRLSPGESLIVEESFSVEIENGEDIIGYQYLHGTNADVGGFQVSGTISKKANGDIHFDLAYTWNDMIDPNLNYRSDAVKSRLAEWIPGVTPTNYKISIHWEDKSILPGRGSSTPRSGWLVALD